MPPTFHIAHLKGYTPKLPPVWPTALLKVRKPRFLVTYTDLLGVVFPRKLLSIFAYSMSYKYSETYASRYLWTLLVHPWWVKLLQTPWDAILAEILKVVFGLFPSRLLVYWIGLFSSAAWEVILTCPFFFHHLAHLLVWLEVIRVWVGLAPLLWLLL